MASLPSTRATLHPLFGAIWERPEGAIPGREMFWVRSRTGAHRWAGAGRWAGIRRAQPVRGHCLRTKLSSGKCRRRPAGPGDHLVERACHLRLEVRLDLVDLGELGEGPAAQRAEVVDR